MSIKVCNRQLAGNHLTTELKQNQPLTVPTLSLAGDSDDLTPRRARAGGPGVSHFGHDQPQHRVGKPLKRVAADFVAAAVVARRVGNGKSGGVVRDEVIGVWPGGP